MDSLRPYLLYIIQTRYEERIINFFFFSASSQCFTILFLQNTLTMKVFFYDFPQNI